MTHEDRIQIQGELLANANGSMTEAELVWTRDFFGRLSDSQFEMVLAASGLEVKQCAKESKLGRDCGPNAYSVSFKGPIERKSAVSHNRAYALAR